MTNGHNYNTANHSKSQLALSGRGLSFISELQHGIILLCVLSQQRQPTYAYNLISKLSDGSVPVETIPHYPLLRRLEGQDLIQSTWNSVLLPFGAIG